MPIVNKKNEIEMKEFQVKELTRELIPLGSGVFGVRTEERYKGPFGLSQETYDANDPDSYDFLIQREGTGCYVLNDRYFYRECTEGMPLVLGKAKPEHISRRWECEFGDEFNAANETFKQGKEPIEGNKALEAALESKADLEEESGVAKAEFNCDGTHMNRGIVPLLQRELDAVFR